MTNPIKPLKLRWGYVIHGLVIAWAIGFLLFNVVVVPAHGRDISLFPVLSSVVLLLSMGVSLYAYRKRWCRCVFCGDRAKYIIYLARTSPKAPVCPDHVSFHKTSDW